MVVVFYKPVWETLLIEEEVEGDPGDGEHGVECDCIVLQDRTDQTNGSKLENTVEEEEGEKAEGLEKLLLDGKRNSSLVQQEGLDPWHGEHQDGAGEGEVLDDRGKPVTVDKDDEELDAELDRSVVETLGDGILCGQGRPLNSAIEQRHSVHDEKLERKGDCGEDGQGGEEEEEADVLCEVGVGASKEVAEAEEGPEGEAKSRQEEAGESDVAVDRILLEALGVVLRSEPTVV